MADFWGGLGNSLETLIGAKGGANYTPTFPVVSEPVAGPQADIAYAQSLDALQKQKAFTDALMGNNALGNQQFVADQLRQQSMGQGPNPAQQALANATGQNIGAQAALMAGQRGANANVGLMARQAAQQGAGIQQQAVGQGALMQAQQQLAAQQALQNLSSNQVSQQQQGLLGYNQAAQSQQQLLLNALAEANRQKVAMASNINAVGGRLAEGQQNNFGQAIQGAGAAIKSIPWGSFFGSGNGSGGGNTGGSSGFEAGSDTLFAAKGGMVKHFDVGGLSDDSSMNDSGMGPRSFVGKFLAGSAGANSSSSSGKPTVSAEGIILGGSPLGSEGDNTAAGISMLNAARGGVGGGANALLARGSNLYNQSGQNPIYGYVTDPRADPAGQLPMNNTSPAVPIANPDFIPVGGDYGGGGGGTDPFGGGVGWGRGVYASKGGAINGESYANQKKMVPGKADVKGDSLKNDKIPAMLSPKEIIIPRSITMSKDAPEKAAKFVAAVLAKNGMTRKQK